MQKPALSATKQPKGLISHEVCCLTFKFWDVFQLARATVYLIRTDTTQAS